MPADALASAGFFSFIGHNIGIEIALIVNLMPTPAELPK
jgi:hypothetical protein